MQWRERSANQSSAEHWFQTFNQAKNLFHEGNDLYLRGREADAHERLAVAKRMLLSLLSRPTPKPSMYGAIASTFLAEVLHMLSHFTMSGYTEAQDYLDQAEKHIANFLHPEILQPTREAMAPYKQENDKLKQQLREEFALRDAFEKEKEMGYWDKEFAETRARVMARQEMERQAAQRQQAEFMAKLEIPMLEPGTESMWHGYWQLDMSLLSPPVTPTYNYPELLQSTSARAMDGYFGVLQPYPNPVYAQDTSLASSRIDIDPLPPGSAAFYATEEYFGSVQPYLNPDDSNRDGENASLISPGGIKFTNPYAPRSASKREFQENAP